MKIKIKKNRIKSVAFLKIDLFLKETIQSPTWEDFKKYLNYIFLWAAV